MVCGRPSASNYCPVHEPQTEEAARNERMGYRKHYLTREYQRNRQHRFERARGRCENCGTHLITGEWECDHLVTIRNGGTNALENLRVLCKPCHKLKTAVDRRTPRFE
jgi:5-methylcytosine-specific restriction protein A